jgi:hypothetical protein
MSHAETGTRRRALMAEVLLLPRILSLTKRDVEKLDGAASV